MSFKLDNKWYLEEFSRQLRSLSGKERIQYFESQRKEITNRLREGYAKHGGSSKFYFDYFETIGKLPEYQNQFAINLYLDKSIHLGPIYQYISQEEFVICDPFLLQITAYNDPQSFLIDYLRKVGISKHTINEALFKLHNSLEKHIGGKTLVDNVQIFREALVFLEILFSEGNDQGTQEFILHFIKLWDLFTSSSRQVSTTYTVVLDAINHSLERSMDNIQVSLPYLINNMNETLFSFNLPCPIITTDVAQITSAGCKKQIEKYRNNLVIIQELMDNKIPISHLLNRYYKLLDNNRSISERYLNLINSRLLKMGRSTIIKELGIDFLKEHYKNDRLIRALVRKFYIHEVLY